MMVFLGVTTIRIYIYINPTASVLDYDRHIIGDITLRVLNQHPMPLVGS